MASLRLATASSTLCPWLIVPTSGHSAAHRSPLCEELQSGSVSPFQRLRAYHTPAGLLAQTGTCHPWCGRASGREAPSPSFPADGRWHAGGELACALRFEHYDCVELGGRAFTAESQSAVRNPGRTQISRATIVEPREQCYTVRVDPPEMRPSGCPRRMADDSLGAWAVPGRRRPGKSVPAPFDRRARW